MYRLVEENRNIERRQQCGSPCSLSSKRTTKSSTLNRSPPRLPYDELQCDEKIRQKEREEILSLGSRLREADNNFTRSTVQPPHLECIMDGSSHSTGHSTCSADERSQARMDLSRSDSNIGASARHRDSLPPLDRRRGRKSHPWQTDVKINRFSSAGTSAGGGPTGRPLTGTSRTQQSTLGWKQRMQERRAVFGNVAVLEQSFDEEDGILDDDESHGENDDKQIQEEAMELLKSKGFQNFQGILNHHYEDDLESVGGSFKNNSQRTPSFLSPTNENRTTIHLNEIQSLRQQILLQQQERADGANHEDEEEEPFDQQANGGATRSAKSLYSDLPAPEDNEDAVNAWKVMKELKVRIQDVFTDDHYIVEAMGRKGVGSPSQEHVYIDENAFVRHKLRDAVQRRVSQVFTGHHVIVCNGQIQVGEGDDNDDDNSVFEESLTNDSGNLESSSEIDHDPQSNDNNGDDSGEEKKTEPEPRESIKSPELRERLSDSFLAFEAMLRARQQAALEAEDDTWTECTESVVEPTIRDQADMLPSMTAATPAGGDDDDQSCYSEYTIDTTAYQTGNRQSIVSLATAVNGASFTDMDDSRKTIKVNNGQANVLASKLRNIAITDDDDDEDEEYEECTVFEEVAVQETPLPVLADPFRQPGQAQWPMQSRRKDSDDQSYMELTVRDGETNYTKGCSSEDQSYMEVTVNDSAVGDSPPTRLPRSKRQVSDDASYMEVTIADHESNPGSFMSPPPPDLTSPHLTNMLRSRMFSDMQLPPELKQQQPPQQSLEDEHANYPMITIGHDDDDMTQITFDHTMDEACSYTEDHRLAAQYLDYSSKPREVPRSFPNGDITSVVGSQHTEQTRDTTVSDDCSSHQDGASFKSCVSSESNQYVAELLRRDIWSPDAEVVQSSLEKLGQEATKGLHERSNIVRYGGLLAMLRAMELKPDKASIQIAAFEALEKMSMDESTQAAIGEVGGIPAIASSMKLHADSVEVQQAACKALSSLTRHREGGSLLSKDPIPTEGVVETVTRTMAKHPENADIQAHAFSTLANLCLDNQTRLRELKKSGGLAAMTMALQVDWANQTDQHEAISTLSILLRSMTLLDKR